jgi:hypothetical protein
MRAAALVLVACVHQAPTEIVITVDSALGVPCTIDALHFEVTGSGEPVVADVPVTGADLPGSLTIVGTGDVDVKVSGMRRGEVLATAEATTAFSTHERLELRIVLDASCIPGPCPEVGVGGYHGMPAPVARAGCGDGGYHIADSLFVVRDACDMHEALMTSVLAPNVNEMEAEWGMAMPFPFTFYGTDVDHVWVGDNGYVAFSTAKPSALTSDVGPAQPLAMAGFPAPAILPFWDDLRTGTSGVCFAVSGVEPSRVMWISWKEACFAPGANACGDPVQGFLSFTVALEETTNKAYIGYHAMQAASPNDERALGQKATIGVTSVGPKPCADTCSPDGLCPDGTSCGFTQYSAQHALSGLPALELVPR